MLASCWVMPISLKTHHTLWQHTQTSHWKMVWIILVDFLPDDHGCNCEAHPYVCRNTLIEGEGNGMGFLVCLHLVENTLCVISSKWTEQMVGTFVLPHASMRARKLHVCLMVHFWGSQKSSSMILQTRAWGHSTIKTKVTCMQKQWRFDIFY